MIKVIMFVKLDMLSLNRLEVQQVDHVLYIFPNKPTLITRVSGVSFH